MPTGTTFHPAPLPPSRITADRGLFFSWSTGWQPPCRQTIRGARQVRAHGSTAAARSVAGRAGSPRHGLQAISAKLFSAGQSLPAAGHMPGYLQPGCHLTEFWRPSYARHPFWWGSSAAPVTASIHACASGHSCPSLVILDRKPVSAVRGMRGLYAHRRRGSRRPYIFAHPGLSTSHKTAPWRPPRQPLGCIDISFQSRPPQ